MSYAEKRNGKITGAFFGEIDQRHKGGPRFRRLFQSKREADGYEAYVKATGQEPPGSPGEHAGSLSFRAVADECRAAGGPRGAWKRGRDPTVLQRLDYVVGLLGDRPITAIDTKAVELLIADLEKRPGLGNRAKGKLSPATINRYLDALSSVLTYAAEHEPPYILRKPRITKRQERGARTETLSDAQENAVRRWMLDQGYRAEELCVRFLIATGFRRGEMEHLRAEQIMTDRVVLDASQTKGNSARLVYIPAALASEMRALIQAGKVPVARQVLRVFKRACDACGYSKSLVLHSLRHTTGTRLIEEGVNMRVVQQFLGHKDIKTTQRYTHVGDALLREAAEKLSPRKGELGPNPQIIPFAQKVNAN